MTAQAGVIQMTLDFKKERKNHAPQPALQMPWIGVAKDAPYFVTEKGEAWTPIGQNDAITWPELKGAFLRKNLNTVEEYLSMLARNGVTCLRLMLEYCHGENRYFEKPVGRFQPHMVQMWDDIFTLCAKYGLRILLTPFDTFWMWKRWEYHPYKRSNGGPCDKRNQWLLCPATRELIKQRLAFATTRWGGSGALFAWDIWNEIHPAHGGDSIAPFAEFIEDVSTFLRQTELRLYGRTHPQTVSVFGPVLYKDPAASESIFRHPALDFASSHFYETGTIDHPKNTVDAAISTGRLTREALAHINNNRPFFDSEHGPIHNFKDRRKTLPEPFDDEYFRHMQWAHFASGGAGGGMRWPNRNPHSLTAGMRKAQQSLAGFLPLIRWQHFKRRNLNEEIRISNNNFAVFGCGDHGQAIIWLLPVNSLNKQRMINSNPGGAPVVIEVPGLQKGRYTITTWDTFHGHTVQVFQKDYLEDDRLQLTELLPEKDIAIAIRRSDNYL